MKELIDQYGRRVRKLRVSLTDKCNLRCHYCMPLDATFMDEKNFLSADEYFNIIQGLTEYGLEEVRLTGGEPLMRKSFTEIIEKISTLGLKKLGLTTNGIFLDKHLDDLKKYKVHHLNVSLDSLDEKNFRKITFGNHLKRILENVDAARDQGFSVKINVVAMKGINDHEIFDFVEFSKAKNLEVRFLEMMRIGYACGNQEDQYLPASSMIAHLKTRYSLKPMTMEKDSTSFNYLVEGAHIGFIASESQAFCGQCSRWRLSADGIMRACLLKDDGLSVKDKTNEERDVLFQTLLGMKPFVRPKEVTHLMHAIGG